MRQRMSRSAQHIPLWSSARGTPQTTITRECQARERVERNSASLMAMPRLVPLGCGMTVLSPMPVPGPMPRTCARGEFGYHQATVDLLARGAGRPHHGHQQAKRSGALDDVAGATTTVGGLPVPHSHHQLHCGQHVFAGGQVRIAI